MTLRTSSAKLLEALAGLAVASLIVAACGGGEPTATPKRAPAATAAPAATRAPVPAPTATPTPPTPTAAPVAPQPKYGGTIQARLNAPITDFDTYTATGRFSFVYGANWVNSLVYLDFDDPSIIRPDLAQRWEVGQNGLVYTFHLARGVQWHDGKPFSSADALYNLNMGWKAPVATRSGNKLLFSRVTTIEAPDENTIRVTLDRASASFLPGLTHPSLLMYPAHIQDLAEWHKTRVGTGPFKFKSYRSDVALESVRNERYWKKDARGGSLPYLDAIVHNSLTTDAGLAAFRSGRLDCGCSFDTDFMSPNRDLLRRLLPDWQEINYYAVAYLYFNQKAPFLDKRARQAVLAGIDRRRFAATNQGGFNYFPSFFFYQRDLKGQWGLPEREILRLPGWRENRAADVALAKSLLKDSGIDPTQHEIVFQGTAFYRDAGPIIDGDLRELGFKPNLVVPATTGEGVQQLRSGAFAIAFQTPAPAYDEPGEYFASYVVSNGPFNYGKWVNTLVDQLYTDIDLELDAAKRYALTERLQRELLDWAVIVPVSYIGRAQGPRGYVKGWNHAKLLSIDIAGRLETVWLDR